MLSSKSGTLLKSTAIAAVIGLSSLIGTSTVAAQATNTATYAMYADIKDWDPAIAFSMEVVMLSNVYEPLLWYKPENDESKFTPALATDWSVSDDGLTWTFNLRENVKFHDQTAFNAEAAKASLERTIAMKKGAYYIWPEMEITAVSEHQLVIKTKTPAAIDLIASSQYGAYIYSTAAAQKGTDWFNQGNAAGTGPYEVTQWEKGQHVILDKTKATGEVGKRSN